MSDTLLGTDNLLVGVDGLRKKPGDKQVLDGLSFAIQRGSVFGLIGPNGAGKTTTIKILLGLLLPDAGRVEIFCEAPMNLSVASRQRIGYLSEEDHPGFVVLAACIVYAPRRLADVPLPPRTVVSG